MSATDQPKAGKAWPDQAAPKKNRSRKSKHNKANVRALAAKLLQQVLEHQHSLDGLFDQARLPAKDKPLLQELVYGCVRFYFSLNAEVQAQLAKPLKPRDSIVGHLLLLGLYQLRHTRIPPHAAVSETVTAAASLGKPWAKALLNQILRKLAATPARIPEDPEARYDQPLWLLTRLQAQYPSQWQALCRVSSERAPMALRVNLRRQSREAYAARLADAGIQARPGLADSALVLTRPLPVTELPGFAQGDLSVQDEGAQLAAGLLAPLAGDLVLDACAAPGGKAQHLMELCPGISLLALDLVPARCEQIRQEQQRLGTAFAVHAADASTLSWWDGRPFQRILLDAPCSGTGTLRRHPDIRLLKHETDILAFTQTQRKMLDNLWQTLAPGGRLLYCTCSILTEENDAVISHLLQQRQDAKPIPIAADWGQATHYGRQLLPGSDGPDGFYFCLLERTP